MSATFQFFVNGDWIEFDDFDEDCSLVHALRDRLALTGTKVACNVGSCGSCTVLVSKYDPHRLNFRHFTVNACITPIYMVHGCHITTIEGLGNSNEGTVHHIQDKIARGNGTQAYTVLFVNSKCGFCTPGMVMSMYGIEAVGKSDDIIDIKRALQGNLCRCTGYRPILEAFNNCSKDCSSCTETCGETKSISDIEDKIKVHGSLQFPHLEGLRSRSTESQNKIGKIEKLLLDYYKHCQYKKEIRFEGPNIAWLIPGCVEELFTMLNEYPEARLVAGCTSQILNGSQCIQPEVVIDISSLASLKSVTVDDTYLRLGATLTIEEMGQEMQKWIKELPVEKTKVLKSIDKMVQTYGSSQIRNVATIGGSLMINSNASDLQTLYTGLGLSLSYLQLTETSNDDVNSLIISSVDIPLSTMEEIFWFEKVSRRKDCDSAILNVAIRIVRKDTQEIFVTFGGTAVNRFTSHFLIASETDITGSIGDSLLKDMHIEIEDKVKEHLSPESLFKVGYVQLLAKSLLLKFDNWLKNENSSTKLQEPIENTFNSTQLYSLVEDSVSSTDLVHRAVPHASAYKHSTGEARFCDDVPKFHNELELAFVLSTRAHAKIKNVDYSRALALNGVVGYVSHEDLLPEKNKFGLVVKDEEVFASATVTCCGQIVAGIVANDRITARNAAKLVDIDYEELTPVILTNEDAIAENSYYDGYGMKLEQGDCKTVLRTSPYIVSGELRIGSQQHFYMEPQSCIAIPKGEDELEIISSTQNPTGVQMEIAHVLGIPANLIVVKVKRVGGGFGGKETRSLMVAVPTAVAAKKFGKPVRCILDRETDMRTTGKRHPFLTRHTIAFDGEGRLQALKMMVYANAGNSLDVSMAPVERLLINLDNAYNLSNIKLEGFVCKTNLPSNTVFRGTGAPQAVLLIENIMDEIAATLEKDPVEIRQLQMYKTGDTTPYGQPLVNCTIRRCWDECLERSKYYKQKLEIEEFNAANQYRKRGIAVTPCHFGIGYTALHLNQGAALVQIYIDGSVLISHSGVEIGQGVHSKMIQIATRELGIPASKIRILETSTDKVPNTTPSSASVTSDMNGMAVLNACRKLVARLQPYSSTNLDASWEQIVTKAYFDRVSLSATGFYKVPDMGWDDITKRGSPFNYFSSGACCSLVELDCLTGVFRIIRTDIVMDVGRSLNPSIDVGQIEGAFMQGVGFFLLEELIHNESGKLETASPLNYKIPTVGDTPLEFNVSLLTDSSNPKAIYSSKTVGEPPLLLATAVFFAVKDAIRSYRKSIGAETVFPMDSPATAEKILMACQG